MKLSFINSHFSVRPQEFGGVRHVPEVEIMLLPLLLSLALPFLLLCVCRMSLVDQLVGVAVLVTCLLATSSKILHRAFHLVLFMMLLFVNALFDIIIVVIIIMVVVFSRMMANF